MPSMSDPSNHDALAQPPKRGPPFKFLVPLIYAPILPLIRIGLRKNPVVRDRVFTAVLAGGFAHGFYLVMKNSEREKLGQGKLFTLEIDSVSAGMFSTVGVWEEQIYMTLRASDSNEA